MIYKIDYKTDKEQVYVMMRSDKLHIDWFLIFNYEEFYKKYMPKPAAFVNLPQLTEDIVDSYMNTVASVPYTKQELIDNVIINIYGSIIKHVEL